MSWEDALMNISILYAVTNIMLFLVSRWVSWEDALMNNSILYAVTNVPSCVQIDELGRRSDERQHPLRSH
jgi:hypothetical protein